MSENFSLKHDKDTRLGFVRKVYGILSTQLAFTVAFCLMAVLPNLSKDTVHSSLLKGFQHMINNETLMIVMIVVYIASVCTLICCGLDKRVPVNYFLLAVITFSMSWMVAAVCTRTDPLVVFEAAVLTFAVTLAITVYAWTTSTDFTVFGPILFIIGFVFCTAGTLMAVFGYHPGLLWSVIGVILFSFYLLFDTQLIMGGEKRRMQIDEDSYILAAITLYLDIINIFLYILEILNDK